MADPRTNIAELHTFDGETSDGDVLSDACLGCVRFVRITTVASPSWVAWYEIEVDTT